MPGYIESYEIPQNYNTRSYKRRVVITLNEKKGKAKSSYNFDTDMKVYTNNTTVTQQQRVQKKTGLSEIDCKQ